jgi:hypothetical protein
MSETPDYGSFVEAPRTEDLTQLALLVDRLHIAELEVLAAEEELRKKQKTAQTLAEIEIPELMTKIGMKSFKTVSGLEVDVKEDIRVSVKEVDRPKAFSWLDKEGHAGLIKSEIVVAFARAEQPKALELQMELEKTYPGNVRQDQWIEPPTLKKFTKDQLSLGKKLPVDIFDVKQFKVAKIKQAK